MLYYIFFGSDLTPEMAVAYFIFGIIAFFISLTLRELFKGIVATKLGDPTPKLAGRLTLNPIKHIDAMGFLAFVLLGVGWAKPMPINPINFKKYKFGTRMVALTGILTNFILGLIAAAVYAVLIATITVSNTFTTYLYMFISIFMVVNSCLTMFHLLPIFPEDCFMFISTFLRPDNKFVQFMVRNGTRMFFAFIFVCIIVEMLTGFDLLDAYLLFIQNYIYTPILLLGIV